MGEQSLIVERQVNEKMVRMNAFIVVVAAALFIFTPAKWVVAVIGVDFFLRGFIKPQYSPIAKINGFILSALNVKPSMVNAIPKMFAAKIGFICAALMGVFYLIDIPANLLLSKAVGVILLFCAFLEAFFGYCVGCKMYAIIQSAKFSRRNT